MQQVTALNLPQGLVDVLRQVPTKLGVAVSLERSQVAEVDRPLQATITNSLADVRERERASSVEALKLRIR